MITVAHFIAEFREDLVEGTWNDARFWVVLPSVLPGFVMAAFHGIRLPTACLTIAKNSKDLL
jgi:hypothetical protein